MNSLSFSNFSISPGYDTPASQSPWSIIPRRLNKKSAKTWLPMQGIILRWVNLLGYHTPASQFFKTWNLNKLAKSQNQNILTHWADSKNEKNEGQESRWTVPLGRQPSFRRPRHLRPAAPGHRRVEWTRHRTHAPPSVHCSSPFWSVIGRRWFEWR